MRAISDLLFRLRALLRPATMERELDDEIEFHLEMATAKNVESGMSPREARRAAEASFGSDLRHRQSARDAWGIVLLNEIRGDGRHALRQMFRRPSSMLLAALVLGLGIGGTVALWSAVHGLLLRPLPFPDEQRLVVFWSDGDWFEAEYDHAREHARAYEDLAAFTWDSVPLRLDERTSLLDQARVTGNLFQTIRAKPLLGRGLEIADGQPGAEKVIVLSFALWQQQMGGADDVLGRRLMLDGEEVTVVGVMPEGFFFPMPEMRAWRPLQIDPGSDNYASNGYLAVLGRVREGVTPEQLESDVATVAVALGERFDYPDAWDKTKGAHVLPLREFLFGEVRPALLLLLGAVSLLWLMACANVAALVVTRTADRRDEMAVRAALGAGRGRLARQVLTESMVLALVGAGVGVALAVAMFRLLVSRLPLAYGFEETLGIGLPSYAAALVLAVLSALGVALFPLRGLAGGVVGALRTRGAGRRGAQDLLVLVEAALAVVLAIGAALLLHSVNNLQRVNPGLDPDGVLAVDLILSSREMDGDDRRVFFAAAAERAAALPGVRSAGTTNRLPLRDYGMQSTVRIESRPELVESAPNSYWRSASLGYFEAAGIELRRGRLFDERDRVGSQPVAVISEGFASKVWGDGDPIGERIKTGNEGWKEWITVVGVVEEVRMRSLQGANTQVLYRPEAQLPWGAVRNTLLLRSDVAPEILAADVRTAMHDIDPRVAIGRVTPLEDVVAGAMAEPVRLRFFLLLMSGFGLALGAVGIYGVVSYQVTRRRTEIGLRMALGAGPNELWREIVGRGLGPVVAGAALGVVAAWGLARLLRGFLFEVSPGDPLSYAGSAAILLAAGVLAAALPAWRASRLDPATTLRSE